MGSRIRACSAPLGCEESTPYPEVKTCPDLCFPLSLVLLSPCWGPWEGHGLHLAAGFSDWPSLSASPLWRSLCEQTPWEWCLHVTLLLVLYFTLLTKHSSRISQNFCARPHSNLTNISWFKCPHCPGREDQVPGHIVDVVLGPHVAHIYLVLAMCLLCTPHCHLSGHSPPIFLVRATQPTPHRKCVPPLSSGWVPPGVPLPLLTWVRVRRWGQWT